MEEEAAVVVIVVIVVIVTVQGIICQRRTMCMLERKMAGIRIQKQTDVRNLMFNFLDGLDLEVKEKKRIENPFDS